MKTIILKSVLCVAIIFASALNTNLMAQGFITNDVKTGDLVTSKIIYRHEGSLYRHMKHDFKYDDQNRIIEKESFKWDSRKNDWAPYCKIDLTYTTDQVIVVYGKWNKKTEAYTDGQERYVYELDDFSMPVAYQNYKWNDQSEEWKIIDNMRFSSQEVLYAIN